MAQDITWGWYKSIVVLSLTWLLLYVYLISFDNFFHLLYIPSDWFLVVITINLSVYNNMQNNTSCSQLHMVVVRKFSNLFTTRHQSLLNHWLLTHLNHLNSLKQYSQSNAILHRTATESVHEFRPSSQSWTTPITLCHTVNMLYVINLVTIFICIIMLLMAGVKDWSQSQLQPFKFG